MPRKGIMAAAIAVALLVPLAAFAVYPNYDFVDWGGPGTNPGEFDLEGRLWVADYGNDRLQYFTSTGTFLGEMGPNGTGDGEFDGPSDVKFDPHGNMYVADESNNRVQKFAPSGTYITEFGTYGTLDGEFDDIDGVEPLRERYVAVTDYYNSRVQRFFSAVPTAEEPIAGSNRFSTAIAASVAGYPSGLMEDAEGYKTVIVATGRNWPDAIGGSALAGVLDAPILLVDTDALPPAVKAEITRLGATRAIVLGETAAVSADVASAIAKKTTNLQTTGFDYTAFVATGDNFPDALACSPIAAANGWPLYLVPSSGLRDTTKAAMQRDGIVDAHILGGTAAVAAATESQLNTLLGDANVDRIDGSTRYATAVEIAMFGQDEANMNWTYTALATGLDFPDWSAFSVRW